MSSGIDARKQTNQSHHRLHIYTLRSSTAVRHKRVDWNKTYQGSNRFSGKLKIHQALQTLVCAAAVPSGSMARLCVLITRLTESREYGLLLYSNSLKSVNYVSSFSCFHFYTTN